MNPAKLNKRLAFFSKSVSGGQEQQNSLFTVWGTRIIKSKRRTDEQNEESYDFLVRSNAAVIPYMLVQVDNVWYDVLTVEPYEKERGFLLLKCEKAKIHNLFDTVTISRSSFVEINYEDVEQLAPVYTSIPCQLVKISGANINQTQQQLDVQIKYVLQLETKYNVKTGDKLEITHKQDTYNAVIDDYFRNHTFQEVTIRMEVDA